VSSRSDDLTADLLQDLTAEQERPAVPANSGQTAPSAVIETAVFLAPSGWQRPGLARDGRSVSISAGPVRVRIRRR
jgi:hypothetical protein